MTTWTLQPQRKKSIKEVIYWHRDGVTISLEEWFRWGTWKCESEQEPQGFGEVKIDPLGRLQVNGVNLEMISRKYEWVRKV